MKKCRFLVLLLLAFVGLAACSSQKSSTETGSSKLNVVATNSIIADITKNIAGDKINLHSIVPVGQDPHEYEPLPEDVKKTSQADLIFYNGINLETGGNAWFTKLVENAKKKENKDYYAVSEGVDVIYLEGQSEKGKEDPHAWLNLENGIIYAKNIAKRLIEKDPVNKETYEKNLKAYVEKLSAMQTRLWMKISASSKMLRSFDKWKSSMVGASGTSQWITKNGECQPIWSMPTTILRRT